MSIQRTSESHTPQLKIERRGRLGILTLNRPEANNVMSFAMVKGLYRHFTEFAADPSVEAIVIRGEGRAFCPGGDVEAIAGTTPGPAFERLRRDYFATEYRLNREICGCHKPVVAFIDGMTMGGGCGLSLHGSHAIATERTTLSMPEMAIGHFPDAGGTLFLNRLPGEMGVYIAMRGLRLNGADALAVGLATHFIPAARLPEALDALAAAPNLNRERVTAILDRFRGEPGKTALPERAARIDALFGGATVEEIVAALECASENWARAALEALKHGSPTSLKVALRQLRDGRSLTAEEALRVEYRIAVRITARDDFREGVRATLVEKDFSPRWRPDRLENVSDQDVARIFAPLQPDEPELEFDDRRGS